MDYPERMLDDGLMPFCFIKSSKTLRIFYVAYLSFLSCSRKWNLWNQWISIIYCKKYICVAKFVPQGINLKDKVEEAEKKLLVKVAIENDENLILQAIALLAHLFVQPLNIC